MPAMPPLNGTAKQGDENAECDDFAKAPDLSDAPVIPQAEFERTLIFEKSENRWDDAERYHLPDIGDIVANYRILSLLGKGGFGAVYCAKNLNLGREEALKLILPSAKSDCSDIDKRFEREVDIVSRLEHPNIVRLYSSGTLEHNVLWMTMELVRGMRLDERLKSGAMKFSKVKAIMLQILCGLMEAHKRQIIHRDLKPANIMLAHKEGYEDQVIILDFGLSKALGSGEDANIQELTTADSRRIYGTPQYMAPEQFNSGKLGPWTDVYAAGLIFYELIFGKTAIDGDSVFEVAFKQSYEPLEYPDYVRGTAVERIIEQACAKNPAERYKNAGEFFDRLQRVEDLSDPVSVLNENRCSGKDIIQHLAANDSGEKTQVALEPLPAATPIRHYESTGGHRVPAKDILHIACYFFSAGFFILLVLFAFSII